MRAGATTSLAEERATAIEEHAFHSVAADTVLAALQSSIQTGLSSAEAAARLQRFGANQGEMTADAPWWQTALRQFKGAVVWLLLGATALSFAVGDVIEAGAIMVVLLVNAAIGFSTERRAEKTMAALRQLTRIPARVRRDGIERLVEAVEVVPGDIVPIEAGEVVPADLRLVEAHDLFADEAALTGESAPVAKTTLELAPQTALADRANMLFRGTSITRGRAVGVVVATGRRTQFGEIVALMAGTEEEATPLEQRLDRLGRQVAVGVFALTLAIVAVGTLAGRDLLEMAKTGIALAVAAVPEGLPIVATLALARGMWRMAARNVLVNRLAAVETLGSTDVLLTDKTGTLTENRMTVTRIILADGVVAIGDAAPSPGAPSATLAAALEIATLCNDAALADDGGPARGDPMEIALLAATEALGVSTAALRDARPRLGELPFDPDLKLMATFHAAGTGRMAAVKGAPEPVLARSAWILAEDGRRPMGETDRQRLGAAARDAAREGLRLLGLAQGAETTSGDEALSELTFVGFLALIDPPRADVADAVAAFRRAGVRVAMVTGDHADTGRTIAQAVGIVESTEERVCESQDLEAATTPEARARLLECRVFARVPPRAKLDLAALYQQGGRVVAMTGDGVNDAPALKKADVGVAMGLRGTQVAREAADIILRDDRFGSIVEAIREGRIIFGNIRNFVRYLLFCNLSEIVVLALATGAGLPLPLLPLQILYLNLITDVMPALALGAGEGARDVMTSPPRPADEPLISRRDWIEILINTAALSASTLAVFVIALAEGAEATSAAFATLALAQLFAVFLLHGRGESLLESEITRNRFVWLAIAVSLTLVAAAFLIPPLAGVLGIGDLDSRMVAIIAIASILPVGAVTLLRRLLPHVETVLPPSTS